MRFAGSDYIPARDDDRLTRQLDRVRTLMQDGHPRTLGAIAAIVHAPEASVSAQLRHLRKHRHGGWRVEKAYAGRGLYQYRLQPPAPAQPTFWEETP